MRLLKPSEISGSILNLLEESDQWVLIVSPYMQISKWYRMLNRIKDLRSRGILPMIYVRDDPDNRSTFLELERLDLPYRKIPYLHSKLYLNESHGIVTSMNLLLSSELRSLEIGHITESSTEHQALMEYCWRYISSFDPAEQGRASLEATAHKPNEHVAAAEIQTLTQEIRTELDARSMSAWAYKSGDCISVCTGRNNYQASISSGYLYLTAMLRIPVRTGTPGAGSAERIAKKVGELSCVKLKLLKESRPGLLQLSGQATRKMKSSCINGLLNSEEPYLKEVLLSFIKASHYL